MVMESGSSPRGDRSSSGIDAFRYRPFYSRTLLSALSVMVLALGGDWYLSGLATLTPPQEKLIYALEFTWHFGVGTLFGLLADRYQGH